MSPRALLQRLALGQLRNVRFGDLHRLLEGLGFSLDRVRGSHHIYRHPAVSERINLQPQGGQAKPYQPRQVMELVEGTI
ncbi:MAG TPA: type II toxin-antitoxin system HicA family toxin [Candidatus Dormibacteraeota bacterium]|nr:type II toxin-antitoxin system HicA family toxin [Candidatus Dormibacteraeota bacterium]